MEVSDAEDASAKNTNAVDDSDDEEEAVDVSETPVGNQASSPEEG